MNSKTTDPVSGVETPAPPSPWQRISDNRIAFETFRNTTPLTVNAPVVVVRPEAVFVTVADMDDLGAWLEARGGVIHRSPVFEGMQTWVLHLDIEATSYHPVIPVQVSVTVVADEPVMGDIEMAVAA